MQKHEQIKLNGGTYQVMEDAPFANGAHGEVWRVKRETDETVLVLKTVRRIDEYGNPYSENVFDCNTDRLRHEIDILNNIPEASQNHIIPLIDSGKHDGLPVFVMPMADNNLLKIVLGRIYRGKPITMQDIFRWCMQIATGLEVLQSIPLKDEDSANIHRDLKFENVLLIKGEAFLSDFGTVKTIENPITSSVAGTPYYGAPESLIPFKKIIQSGNPNYKYTIGPQSDIYALGLIVFGLCTEGAIPRNQSWLNEMLENKGRDGLLPHFGRVGGLNDDDRNAFRRCVTALMTSPKGTIAGEPSENFIQLPDPALICEELLSTVENMLCKEMLNRPKIDEVKHRFNTLAAMITPSLSRLRIQPPGIVTLNSAFDVHITANGEGLPENGRWLQVTVDGQKALSVEPGDTDIWKVRLPAIPKEGPCRIEAMAVVNRKPIQETVSIEVTATPEQKWAMGRHIEAMIEAPDNTQWHDYVRKDARSENCMRLSYWYDVLEKVYSEQRMYNDIARLFFELETLKKENEASKSSKSVMIPILTGIVAALLMVVFWWWWHRPGVSPPLSKDFKHTVAATVEPAAVPLSPAPEAAKPAPEPARPVEITKVPLRFITDPAGGLIEVKGIHGFRNGMPVPEGVYIVTATMNGYKPLAREIEVTSEMNGPVRLTLEPLPARLYVNTTPSADRIRILNIPQKFQQGMELPPGRYQIEVVLKGYETRIEWIEAYPGREIRLDWDLVAARGRLHMTIKPDWAEVIIKGVGNYSSGMSLMPGEYRVRGIADGYEPVDRSVTIRPGQEAWVEIELKRLGPKPGSLITDTVIGAQFAWIPPTGPNGFMMGQTDQERVDLLAQFGEEEYQEYYSDEHPHRVVLSRGFYMQTTEVTVAQWRVFARFKEYVTQAEKDGGTHIFNKRYDTWEKKADMNWMNPGFEQGGDHPVTCVSWNDVQEYIKWLNSKGEGFYRLPTEAEWEYACRAGTTTPFHTGECLLADMANYWGCLTYKNCPEGEYRRGTIAVGSLRSPNDWGLHDMHGNVAEWCMDEYIHNYEDPEPIPYRVKRGGGWDSGSTDCRSASRLWAGTDFRENSIGFRLVFVPPVQDEQ